MGNSQDEIWWVGKQRYGTFCYDFLFNFQFTFTYNLTNTILFEVVGNQYWMTAFFTSVFWAGLLYLIVLPGLGSLREPCIIDHHQESTFLCSLFLIYLFVFLVWPHQFHSTIFTYNFFQFVLLYHSFIHSICSVATVHSPLRSIDSESGFDMCSVSVVFCHSYHMKGN